MNKSQKTLFIVTWGMIAVGAFSIITGFISFIGYSDVISDLTGNTTMFNFINGGPYFMLCGVIHIIAAYFGMRFIKKQLSSVLCIAIGIFTLAWQLAAFIYLLTEGLLSLRAAMMVIFPIVYLTLVIILEVRERTTLVDEAGETNNNKKAVPVKRNFFDFNFSFKRKTFNGIHLEGKRKSRRFDGFRFSRKRRKSRFNLKPKRTFRRR